MYRANNSGVRARGDSLEDRADKLLSWLDAGRDNTRNAGCAAAESTLSTNAAAAMHQASWQASHSSQLPGFKCF